MARVAAAHVFVEDLDDPRLGPDDLHHVTRVLRVRAGEVVSAADGTGGWRRTVLGAAGRLEGIGPAFRAEPLRPPITIAMAVAKGDRPEWAVQKLTELGVDRIIPLITARGVVRWDTGRAPRHLERWRAVARQASMQSRRLRLPLVEEPASVAELAARADLVAVMAEPGGAPPTLERPAVLIGPEGGWAPEERASGLPVVGLVPTVLRTETAAVAATALLAALRAGTVRPAPT